MILNAKNPGSLTPIHTDFGSSPNDLLVTEYDVPQANVKKTLFYKYGQLSIPKWALIPAGIVTFGLLTALCAIIVNAILSQPSSSVTYSQACSKTSKCRSELGLTCGSQSKCACSSQQYWYEGRCDAKPTYTQQCNQTTECRTDLGLICAEFQDQCNCPNTTIIQTCDCPSNSYWTGSMCTVRLSYLGTCSIPDISYQCISNLYCDGSRCTCSPNTQYWNLTANECYSVDKYHALCDPLTSYSCDAIASLSCLSDGLGSQCPFNVTPNATSCDCANGTYWNGGSCVVKKTIDASCFWNCECNLDVGLQCLNMSCVCPKKTFWSTALLCGNQRNYTDACTNTSQCDTTQGLMCNLAGSICNCPQSSTSNMCDCLPTQYYDYNLTSCQNLHLYNDTCTANYTCDRSVGLFCQMTNSSTVNCSCPEPFRLNMCDCNMTSFWDGIACVPRLAANVSCSFPYQCEGNLTCIANQTDIGIFSDVCRCPLGSYFVNGSGCVISQTYTQSCNGSYQCYELAPLSCRYNDTGLTCLDTDNYALPRCDCSDYHYFDNLTNKCLPFLNRTDVCTDSCQCTPPYQCMSGVCGCYNFFSSINQTCVEYLTYGDQCSNTSQCNATPNALLSCNSGTCACGAWGFWDGSQCRFTINFRSICSSDSNCFTGLTCRNIPCIDSNTRCSCPDKKAYSSTYGNCTNCDGGAGSSYENYVINYYASDVCVAVRSPGGKLKDSIAFSTANTQCSGLTPLMSGIIPRLLSLHNLTELNCLGQVLEAKEKDKTCDKSRYHYLGYTPANMTFYDRTPYTAVFSTPAIEASQCLTFCFNNDKTGKLSFESCTDFFSSNRYGAICDYLIP